MPRDSAYLLDIVQSAKLVARYVEGTAREAFLRDEQLQDAVVRRLLVIGEAARRVSTETRNTLPDVPWAAMTGMRNVLAHQYDDVDYGTVWDTAQRDLPRLIAVLEPLVPDG